MSDCDSNLTQSGPPNGQNTFGLDARSRDIFCDHGVPCEKTTWHSLAPETTSPLAMVRSDKVHVVVITLARVLLRNPLSDVRLFRHITETHELFCLALSELFF